jgi:hypothetical protein
VREIGGSRPNDIGTLARKAMTSSTSSKPYMCRSGTSKKGLSATLGRQFLSYGDQRLVGPLEWLNQARTFDAVKFRYTAEKYSLDFFVSSPVNLHEQHVEPVAPSSTTTSRSTRCSAAFTSPPLFVPFNSPPTSTSSTSVMTAMPPLARAVVTPSFYTFGTLWKGDPKKLGGFDYKPKWPIRQARCPVVISAPSPATGQWATTGSSILEAPHRHPIQLQPR